MTTLAEIVGRLERGEFPAVDFGVTVVRPDQESCVLALTGHNVIAADVDPGWLAARLPADDVAAPLSPAFLHDLAEHTGHQVDGIDAMLLASPVTDAGIPDGLVPADDLHHPRLLRAQHCRSEVRAWQDPYGGLVLLGRGLAGRLECAVEVAPERRGRGDGRRLARAARLLAPAGVPLWAQVTPGNAASLRAFLAAGFRPIGSEALLVR